MEFFDSLKQNIMSAGKDISEKTRELTDTARMKLDVKNKEDYIKQLYAEIGKRYYEEHKEDLEQTYPQVTLVKKAQAELDKLNEELLLVKGSRTCSDCGKEVSKSSAFCHFCGAKLEPIQKEESSQQENAPEDHFDTNEAENHENDAVSLDKEDTL